MINKRISSKITQHHLDRKALVYPRQSSDRQVQENLESQRLQYALADWARDMGWAEVEIIDDDLGASASVGSPERKGFDRLIERVVHGDVGIILAREASRLSRTDRDWCRVFEVCPVLDTLIGDGQQVYDLNLMDDQLVMGIKGTMSVAELKVLQSRLRAGAEAKARRGQLERMLPPGYVRDVEGKSVKDPDRRVQEAIELVFRKFRDLWSVRQTFLWFHAEGIELPVNKKHNGRVRLVWQLPTYPFVKDVLQNPYYAGAYVWGRRQTETVIVGGKVRKRQTAPLAPELWKVLLRDHHEAYIDWEVFEENQRRMSNNSLKYESNESVRAVRAGQGLLVGLLRCRRCGGKFHIRYSGRNGTAGRYYCKGDFDRGGRYCLAFGSSFVDKRFTAELLKVISPLGAQASLQALDRLCRGSEDQRQALARQLEQAEYEALRAFEQYDEVDPRNRLVAAELEQRWNCRLEEVSALKEALGRMQEQPPLLSAAERERILAFGERFAEVWEHEHCPVELKKKIVRTVVEEVLVEEGESNQELRFIVHWKGGVHTPFAMPRALVPRGRKTSADDVEVIARMAARYGDDDIARVLNKLGRRTGGDKRWNVQRVARVRGRYSIAGRSRTHPDPEVLTLHTAAKHCGVSQTTIKRLVAVKILPMAQVVPWAPWEIRRPDLDSEPVRGIIEYLRNTGKLVLARGASDNQRSLFKENLHD
jgi:DNA invertase Pin-like site-specific DNA recombinase